MVFDIKSTDSDGERLFQEAKGVLREAGEFWAPSRHSCCVVTAGTQVYRNPCGEGELGDMAFLRSCRSMLRMLTYTTFTLMPTL